MPTKQKPKTLVKLINNKSSTDLSKSVRKTLEQKDVKKNIKEMYDNQIALAKKEINQNCWERLKTLLDKEMSIKFTVKGIKSELVLNGGASYLSIKDISSHMQNILIEAINSKKVDIVKLLIQHYPIIDVNLASSGHFAHIEVECTPIMYAAMTGCCETIKVLVAANANVCASIKHFNNTQKSSGSGALMWAVRNGHAEAVRLILNYPGVNIDDCVFLGYPLLVMAPKALNATIIDILLEKKPNLFVTAPSGITPFIFALNLKAPFAKKLIKHEHIIGFSKLGIPLKALLEPASENSLTENIKKIRIKNIILSSIKQYNPESMINQKIWEETERTIDQLVIEILTGEDYSVDDEGGIHINLLNSLNLGSFFRTEHNTRSKLKRSSKTKPTVMLNAINDVFHAKDEFWSTFMTTLKRNMQNFKDAPFYALVSITQAELTLIKHLHTELKRTNAEYSYDNNSIKEMISEQLFIYQKIDNFIQKIKILEPLKDYTSNQKIITKLTQLLHKHSIKLLDTADTLFCFKSSYGFSVNFYDRGKIEITPPVIKMPESQLLLAVKKTLEHCHTTTTIPNDTSIELTLSENLLFYSNEYNLAIQQYLIKAQNTYIAKISLYIAHSSEANIQASTQTARNDLESIKQFILESNCYLDLFSTEMKNLQQTIKKNAIGLEKLKNLTKKMNKLDVTYETLLADFTVNFDDLTQMHIRLQKEMTNDITLPLLKFSNYLSNALNCIDQYEACLRDRKHLCEEVANLYSELKRQRASEKKSENNYKLAHNLSETHLTEKFIQARINAEKEMMAIIQEDENKQTKEKQTEQFKTLLLKKKQVKDELATKKDIQSKEQSKSQTVSMPAIKSHSCSTKNAPTHTLGSIMRIEQRIHVHVDLQSLKSLLSSVSYSEAESKQFQYEQLVLIQYALLGLSAILMEHVKQVNDTRVFPYTLAKSFRNNLFHHSYDLIPIFSENDIQKLSNFNMQIKFMIEGIVQFLEDKDRHKQYNGDRNKIENSIKSDLFNQILAYVILDKTKQTTESDTIKSELLKDIERGEHILKTILSVKTTPTFKLREDIKQNAVHYAYARLGVHATDYSQIAKVKPSEKLANYIEFGKILRHSNKKTATFSAQGSAVANATATASTATASHVSTSASASHIR